MTWPLLFLIDTANAEGFVIVILALGVFFAGNAALAAAGYLDQTSVNRYLTARYPEARARTSAGEIVAAVLGLIVTVLVVIGSFVSR